MLVSPVRPFNSGPFNPSPQSYSTPLRLPGSSPHAQQFRSQVLGAMLSVMPLTRPHASKKPKLSLQTTIATAPPPPPQKKSTPSDLPSQSPTTRNTRANCLQNPAPDVHLDHSSFPTKSCTDSRSSSLEESPVSPSAPYVLPIGTHSILRNSPLPRRPASATSAQRPRRLFKLVKEVKFHEQMVHVIPVSEGEAPLDSDMSGQVPTDEGQELEQETFVAEDGRATLVCRRRRHKREFTWRPQDDEDVLIAHHLTPNPILEGQGSRPLPATAPQETTPHSEPPSKPFIDVIRPDSNLGKQPSTYVLRDSWPLH